MPFDYSRDKQPNKEAISVEFDPRLARLVFKLYTQELSLISDYIYCNILLDGVYDSLPGSEYVRNLSDTFEQFALDSMRHFKILGSLTYALGCNPALNARVFNSPYNLSDDLGSRAPVVCERMVRSLLKFESSLICEYQSLIASSSDPQVVRILSAILADKQSHVDTFENTKI